MLFRTGFAHSKKTLNVKALEKCATDYLKLLILTNILRHTQHKLLSMQLNELTDCILLR